MRTSTPIEPEMQRQGRFQRPIVLAKAVIITPQEFDAVLFDMDGVVTKTAKVHAAAWKRVFDEFLKQRLPADFKPFDIDQDYRLYVDGKARSDGVQSFLSSRGVDVPLGKPGDLPGFESVCAIGSLKDQDFLTRLQEHGVEAYETTVALIQALKKEGLKVAVITASENGAAVLHAANLAHLFDAKVDGLDAIRLGLKGKPAPDTFVEAAKQLRVDPKRAVVVEDAVAGVEAGRKGNFGLVIGVDRYQQADLLKQHGADVVVRDLSEVRVPGQCTELPGMALADLGVTEQNWLLIYDEYSPELEGRREALCACGNGYFVTRAAAPESHADGIHAPGTYLAGGYNRLKTETAGIVLEHEDLVNMPNWLSTSFQIEDGAWFDLASVEILRYKQTLNLREGILYRSIRFRDTEGRETTLSERRFVHMRHFHLAGLESIVTAHNWSGLMTIRSALDGRVINNGTKMYAFMNKKHLQPVDSAVEDEILYLQMQTSQSRIAVAEAARIRLFRDEEELKSEVTSIVEADYVVQDFRFRVATGDRITIQKTVSLFTSRDCNISEAGLAAREAISNAPEFQSLIDDQVEAWRHLWRRFDFALETKEEDRSKMQVSLFLHLNSFHALQTASPNSIDLDIGMPARGWSEGYQGHIFWDGLFVFPFLNLRMPSITQALLKYRYRRLDEARKLARKMGVKGARYPWQSGSTGREETPKSIWYPDSRAWIPDYTHMEVHVNAAIAFDIWQYYQATGNLEFMYTHGADMLLEIARFFASFAHYNVKRDRFEIHGVVGPDEFHVAYPGADQPGINNNSYTNLMAAWTICRALELLEILPVDYRDEICDRLNLTDDELKWWERVSRRMFVPIQHNGIISQFEGFEKLQEFPRRKDGRIDGERLEQVLKEQNGLANQYQVSKQADVLMLFYLFSAEELKELFDRLDYPFRAESIPDNIEFYMRQTGHDSTLSRVACAFILSRLDRSHAWKFFPAVSSQPAPQDSTEPVRFPRSWNMFREALESDFFDIHAGTTAEGIHMGAMAGTVDIVQRCYTGIVLRGDVLWLNPCLPEELTRLSFHLHYRHQMVQFEITQVTASVSICQSSARPIKIGFQGRVHELNAGESRTFQLATRPDRHTA